MRVVVLEKFGRLDSLVHKEIPDPKPKAGHVVIEIKAFGINHAEMHMRRGEWAEAAKVIGIECVGLVKSCPGGEFPIGAKVAALMGGLGRTINGSYAEYTRAPVSNVALIESDLPWAELAVIPETCATAWTCLFRNLEITKSQTLVIRGATSSFGQAAFNMAANSSARVIATTRSQQRFAMLQELSAERVELEGPGFPSASPKPNNSMQCSILSATAQSSTPSPCSAGAAARASQVGWAGSRRSRTSIRCCKCPAASTSPSSAVLCSAHPVFPLSDVPLQEIAREVAARRLKAKPARVFRFEEIREAHRAMEANEAGGKMVVVL